MLNRYKILVLVLLIFILMGAVSASENVTGTSTNNDAVTGDVLASPDNGQVSSVANSNNNVGNVTNVTKNNNINLYGSVDNVVFDGNFTSNKVTSTGTNYGGGALYFANTVTDSKFLADFTSNTATYHGGAIYIAGITTNNVFRGAYNSNKQTSSGYYGGAIYIKGASSGNNFTADFISNTASYGGAISMASTSANDLFRGNFSGNTALRMGGAVYIYGAVNNVVFDGNFTSNKVTSTGTNYGGGALYFANTVTDSKFLADFTSNTATYYGGAIYIASTATSNVFRGVYNNNKQTTSGYYGGAIYIKGASSGNNFTTDFTNNTAGYGGAIYMSSTSTNDLFRGNFSSNYGGAIYISGAVSGTVITNSTFLKNQARSTSLTFTKVNNTASIITFTGYNNWINAIYTSHSAATLSFNNVTYYNGNIVNSDDVNPKKSTKEAGINVTYNICLYYSDDSIEWINSTGITNDDGQIFINNTKPLDYAATGNMYLANTDYYSSLSVNVNVNYLPNIYVDGAKGNDNNPGTIYLPYKTMDTAFSKVSSGNSIYIAPGTYSGTSNTGFNVGKIVSLYRWDNGVTGDVIFDGQSSRRSGWAINANTFNIYDGFVFRNGKVTSTNYGGALYFGYSNGLKNSVINATFISNTAELRVVLFMLVVL